MLLRAPAGTRFERNLNDNMMAVSRDGRRFLVSTSHGADQTGDLVIVENFLTELRAALAAGKAE